MEVLTEAMIRNQLKGMDLTTLNKFEVKEGVLLTPSAKSFLTEKRIHLCTVSNKDAVKETSTPEKNAGLVPVSATVAENITTAPSNLPPFKKTVFEGVAGGVYETKPEHMTHLYGAKLVNKDHPVIAFRGALDNLEAKILEIQIIAYKNGKQRLVDELQETLDYVKNILKSEVTRKDFPSIDLLGLSSEDLRAQSHHPKEHFGVNHFAPTYQHGEVVILLNALRAQSRSVELAAYQAFKDENGLPTRPDLIEALNRLSSVYYIMMFRALTNQYEEKG